MTALSASPGGASSVITTPEGLISTAFAQTLQQNIQTARPDDISALGSSYRTYAEQALSTARGLTAAASATQWTGKAAEQFQTEVGKLPAHLDTVHAAYGAVGDALCNYANQIPDFQSRLQVISAGLDTAQSSLANAQGQESGAKAKLKAVINQPPDPGHEGAVERAMTVLSSARNLVGYYEGEVSHHSRRRMELLGDFLHLREQTRAQITTGAESAPGAPSVTVTAVGSAAAGAGVAAVGALPTVATAGGAVGTAAGAGSAVLVPENATAEIKTRLTAMNETVNSLMGTPYVWGGGHGAAFGPSNGGLDCSGFVSTVLHSAGYLSTPQTTTGLAGQPALANGAGQYVTVYDRTNAGIGNDHVIMSINGHFFEEGGGAASGGAMNVHAFTPGASYLASFNRVMHPVGL